MMDFPELAERRASSAVCGNSGEEVETALLSATEEIKKIKKSRFVFVSLDSRGLMRQMRLGKCHDYDFRGDIMLSPPNTI